MPKNSKKNIMDPDDPVLTDEMFARAKRRSELPTDIQKLLPRSRGPQRAPTKVPVTIRLSHEVVDAFKATGSGWQTLMDDVLKRAAKRLPTPAETK